MAFETQDLILPPVCCYDSQAAPLGRYAQEMLFAEGVTGAEEHDVRQMPLTADALRERQAVIVAPCGEDTQCGGGGAGGAAPRHAGGFLTSLRRDRCGARH